MVAPPLSEGLVLPFWNLNRKGSIEEQIPNIIHKDITQINSNKCWEPTISPSKLFLKCTLCMNTLTEGSFINIYKVGEA